MKCDAGLRISPEQGTLIIHYNMAPQGHMDGAVDPKAYNAHCDVEGTEEQADGSGAWRATQYFVNRMPERPLQHQAGAPLPGGNPNEMGGPPAGGGAPPGGTMKVDFKEEEASAGWF